MLQHNTNIHLFALTVHKLSAFISVLFIKNIVFISENVNLVIWGLFSLIAVLKAYIAYTGL